MQAVFASRGLCAHLTVRRGSAWRVRGIGRSQWNVLRMSARAPDGSEECVLSGPCPRVSALRRSLRCSACFGCLV
eukprot:6193527-Pleurochrysis_carterae.AAC.1